MIKLVKIGYSLAACFSDLELVRLLESIVKICKIEALGMKNWLFSCNCMSGDLCVFQIDHFWGKTKTSNLVFKQ